VDTLPDVAWEPPIVPEISAEAPLVELAPGVPVEFEHETDILRSWGRDGHHHPTALTPLAVDYALVMGNSLNAYGKAFPDSYPQRWSVTALHGYMYYAWEPNVPAAEWPAVRARMREHCWERAKVTAERWDRDVLPELRSIYERTDAIDVDGASADDLADAWERAWDDTERTWQLHMDITAGPREVLERLADAYAPAAPDAPPGEAYRLVPGSDHELHQFERAMQELAAIAAATPAVAAALRSGVRSLEQLSAVDGGATFVEIVNGVLATHGHLGQTADDLELPSFADVPSALMTEVAKRLDADTPDAEARRARLTAEAEELAQRARLRLADQPAALASFEAVLHLAREIGPIKERHNYWIDRASQAHLRRFVLRVGARLVREGVIAEPHDVFYLRRSEVGPLLRRPDDRRGLVATRRRQHEIDRRIQPAPEVGAKEIWPDAPTAAEPATSEDPAPAPEPPSDAAVLRGIGASAGVVRGRARVVAGAEEFGRIGHGDIIVCHASNPSWVPVLAIAAGLVTDVGGLLSHAAVVAREFGLPAVVGVRGALLTIQDGREIEVDGIAGTVRLVAHM
jgi:pyruvate,water dikinase